MVRLYKRFVSTLCLYSGRSWCKVPSIYKTNIITVSLCNGAHENSIHQQFEWYIFVIDLPNGKLYLIIPTDKVVVNCINWFSFKQTKKRLSHYWLWSDTIKYRKIDFHYVLSAWYTWSRERLPLQLIRLMFTDIQNSLVNPHLPLVRHDSSHLKLVQIVAEVTSSHSNLEQERFGRNWIVTTERYLSWFSGQFRCTLLV